jgi:nicotinate-nucleotide adenylyltransferase
MKIGLFGGTFDPIHLGHTEIIKIAHDVFHLDQIYLIPCYHSPHKLNQAPTSSENRIKMIAGAIQDLPYCSLSNIEVEKSEPSYSYLTAQYFHQKYPDADLYWIFGSDQWKVIDKWTKPEILADLVTFIIFPRPDLPQEKEGFKHLTLDFNYPISSTEIRERIKNKQSISDLVPPGVEKVIELHQLYR